mgnify:CR=1 FL=1
MVSPGLGLILLDVDGGKHVVLHHALVEEDGVLVVVTLPGHKAHEDVLAQRDLPLVGGGAVGDDIPLLHPVPQETMGRWLMQVPWLDRRNLMRG